MGKKSHSKNGVGFDTEATLEALRHYLPSQAPLKDFIHHNTLHAFQDEPFFNGLFSASQIFGYTTLLPLDEYRARFAAGEINLQILDRVILEHVGKDEHGQWLDKLLHLRAETEPRPRIGMLRALWKQEYHLDLDSQVHPTLFRLLCSYLDQGVSIWQFPTKHLGFLDAIRELESNAWVSLFRTRQARELLLNSECQLVDLLAIIVGDERLYEQYLFDQQFAHPGWSGMVATIEALPDSLLDRRSIRLNDMLIIECLLEIDALHLRLAKGWAPLASRVTTWPVELFRPSPMTESHQMQSLWQRAFEWSYYDQVLGALQQVGTAQRAPNSTSFQALFCIDDRECSFRTYLEQTDTSCKTFGTPGFFAVDTFYQPDGGQFTEKVCPAPITPKHLIKDIPAFGRARRRKQEAHLHKASHSFHSGAIITQTLGVFAALRLAFDIFWPSARPAAASSFKHMHKDNALTVEHRDEYETESGLQIGFNIDEMTKRVESLLKSIGLVNHFAPIVYVVGHGSSSVNNPHYAAYDCGACSGRAGSVNSRAISSMANHPLVREELRRRHIDIPESTQFLGGLHDTTRDEIEFYDEESLSVANRSHHVKNQEVFETALALNAKERSRRFLTTNNQRTPAQVHKDVKRRSISLFEPRPELNHATNALCVVGRRSLTSSLFLDRRAFLNSYDYRVDSSGDYLLGILRAAAPVCGGINLEYFFSRVDNQKLGAGTKLPHNVMGLVGVANGNDGDLRPGLPSQMIEVHDPLRLLLVVEQKPDFVLDVILRSPETYAWFDKDWVKLATVDPESRALHVFGNGAFHPYQALASVFGSAGDLELLVETHHLNLPVLRLDNNRNSVLQAALPTA